MWKRWIVAAVALWGLACTGLTEKAVELSTGGSMDISENGDVTMEFPDGSKVVTKQGGEPPADFPLPPPYADAVVQAVVTTTSPSGDESWIVTYEMNSTREAIVATYTGWLDVNATDVKHKKENTAGIVTEVLSGKVGEAGVVVTLTEAYGANSVSVVWAPAGMDSLPQKKGL